MAPMGKDSVIHQETIHNAVPNTQALDVLTGSAKQSKKSAGPKASWKSWLKFVRMKLVLATQNPNKVKEIQAVLPTDWKVVTAHELGVTEELPETGDTLEANAIQKATALFDLTGALCMADDSGLEVDALGGAPGVYSARYAGESKDDAANRAKLLHELRGSINRRAQFRTVIALVGPDGAQTFEGCAVGHIVREERGENGFGYDSIFESEDIPNQTFAEVKPEAKRAVSHRSRAIAEMLKGLSLGD